MLESGHGLHMSLKAFSSSSTDGFGDGLIVYVAGKVVSKMSKNKSFTSSKISIKYLKYVFYNILHYIIPLMSLSKSWPLIG